MDPLTHEIARVRRFLPGNQEWMTERSRAARNGLYTSVLSAQRAVKQFKAGSWGIEYAFKVQKLQAFPDFINDTPSMEWVDVD